MKDVKNILCPLDLSEHSVHAYRFARYLANKLVANLWILHVVPESPEYYLSMFPELSDIVGGVSEWVEDRIAEMVDLEAENVRKVVLSGRPVDEILKFREHRNIDLIVMGARGLSPLESLLLGSTTDRIIRQAPCPVTVVRTCPEHPRVEHIVVPTDLSEYSDHAAEEAIYFAANLGADIHLLHIVEVYTYEPRKMETRLSEEKLHEMQEKIRSLMSIPGDTKGVSVEKVLIRGYDAAYEISHYVRDTDLIVMATHGRKAISKLLMGSVTDKVLRSAPCPVMTVRHPRHME